MGRIAGSQTGLTPWPAQLKRDLFATGLDRYWNNSESVSELSPDQWRSIVKSAVQSREQARWWRAVQHKSSLISYIPLKHGLLQLESYLLTSHHGWKDLRLIGRRMLTRLRCGNNELLTHIARYRDLPESASLCELCGVESESEEHFLIHCQHFRSQRSTLYQQIDSIVQSAASERSASAVDAASQSAFTLQSQSAACQFRMLLCDLSCIPFRLTVPVQHRLIRLILVAVGQWSIDRKKHMQTVEQMQQQQ